MYFVTNFATVVILYLRHVFHWQEDTVGTFLALFKASQGNRLPFVLRDFFYYSFWTFLLYKTKLSESLLILIPIATLTISLLFFHVILFVNNIFLAQGLSVLIILKLITHFFGQKAKDYPLAQVSCHLLLVYVKFLFNQYRLCFFDGNR